MGTRLWGWHGLFTAQGHPGEWAGGSHPALCSAGQDGAVAESRLGLTDSWGALNPTPSLTLLVGLRFSHLQVVGQFWGEKRKGSCVCVHAHVAAGNQAGVAGGILGNLLIPPMPPDPFYCSPERTREETHPRPTLSLEAVTG